MIAIYTILPLFCTLFTQIAIVKSSFECFFECALKIKCTTLNVCGRELFASWIDYLLLDDVNSGAVLRGLIEKSTKFFFS